MTLYDSTKNAIHGFYKTMMEGAMPVATKSEFMEKGVLTPDEFVQAGDKLVNQCRTWTWETGDKEKKRDYFKDKQFLQARNVPCTARVASLQKNAQESIVENGEWLAMDDESMKNLTQNIADVDLDAVMDIDDIDGNKIDKNSKKTNDNNNNNNNNGNKNGNDKNESTGIINIVEHSAFNAPAKTESNMSKNKNDDDDDDANLSDSFEEIPDIETFDDQDNVVPKNKESNNKNQKKNEKDNSKNDKSNDNNNHNNVNSNKHETENKENKENEEKKMDDIDNNRLEPMFKLQQEDDNILKTRTYDISITYDKYYKVPRVWLRGYDENANPLTSAQIFEDISADHAHKTVTVETHPHMNVVCASIHPCRHSEVMKIFMDKMNESGEQVTVEQYMFLFLKFMSAVIPTIEYDWTESVDG